ncbi:MAG: hypothetical protein ABI180_14725 [Microcoleus sp.]
MEKGRWKKEKGRRKMEEGSRKKEDGKIILLSPFPLLPLSHSPPL